MARSWSHVETLTFLHYAIVLLYQWCIVPGEQGFGISLVLVSYMPKKGFEHPLSMQALFCRVAYIVVFAWLDGGM